MTVDPLTGPYRIGDDDIAPLNQLFSDAFTERYRRDGLAGVRVPPLNPAIWRFALADAADGAMLWRDADGAIGAFNVAHRSGTEGWMGPLAVRTTLQGRAIGQTIVRAGIDWLRGSGATMIGLETMPRTVDNIGFYSALGFAVGPLTVTFTLEGMSGNAVDRIGRYGPRDRDALVEECTALTAAVSPGRDFIREILLTAELVLGDTVLLRDGDQLAGFAVCHTAPLVEGRGRDEVRVLKIVLADARHMPAMVRVLAIFARESMTQRVALRVQSNYESAYRAVVAARGRVRWTDLRMTLSGYPENVPQRGVVFSNWEI